MSTSLASARADIDVVVIGAGVAGLAAAATLHESGVTVAILEAGTRTGGRAWTGHPAQLGFHAFDHGASWLHAAHRNPLIPLARAQGEPVHPDTPWENRVHVFDESGGPAAWAEYENADSRWRSAVTARLAGPDCSLADAASAVACDPWTATIETWEGAIIAAADADQLSLHDWHDNELDGDNYVAQGGLGALLARILAPRPDEIKFAARVTAIEAEPQGVRLRIADGQGFRAGAAIVTVSTGVLRDGGIAFTPGLPPDMLAALDGLPMGLLTKIALCATSQDRLGFPPGTGFFRRVARRGAPGASVILWPDDAPIAIGFIGGRAAWDFCARPEDACALLRDEIATLLGCSARKTFAPDGLMTEWGTDPAFRGAYAYATPGNAGARKTLATPIWGGRLIFAGEACAIDGMAGTVAGAYLSGQHAAQTLLTGFPRPRASV